MQKHLSLFYVGLVFLPIKIYNESKQRTGGKYEKTAFENECVYYGCDLRYLCYAILLY